MVQVFVLAMTSLAAVIVFDLLVQPRKGTGAIMMSGLIVLVLTAARIQFSQKCPACGARLGLQTRLLLPRECGRCGVSFRKESQK